MRPEPDVRICRCVRSTHVVIRRHHARRNQIACIARRTFETPPVSRRSPSPSLASRARARQIRRFPARPARPRFGAGPLVFGSRWRIGAPPRQRHLPVARQNGAQGWLAVPSSSRSSFVAGHHLRRSSPRLDGTRHRLVETQSTSGEGEQTLVFGPPAVAVPAFGPYVARSLPAMEEVNQPSYRVIYRRRA